MAILNNNPTFTYTSWKNMVIEFNKEHYPVANGYSNMKYLYWDASQPYKLIETNERKKEIGNRFLLIINDKGIYTLVPNDNFKVTFDGDNPDAILNNITSIYESIDGIGDKFVNVETDISGVKQTVGQVSEEQGVIKEQVTQIKQTVGDIDLSVNNVQKEFTDNKQVLELREKLNKSIIDFNTVLGIFKSDTTSFFKDSKISTEEKTAINIHLDQLDNRKANVILHVDTVLTMLQSEGQTDQYNSLNSSKSKFLNSVLNLRTYITTAVSDNTIVPSEITAIIDLFGKASTGINLLKNSVDDSIYLGAGGSISTELARIGIKSDEIIFNVSKTEESIRNDVDLIKQTLEGQIGDVNTSLSDLENVMNTTFKDGIVSEVEKEILNERIKILDKEKEDISSQYNSFYSNAYLTDPVKSDLKRDYDLYINKHSELKNKILQAIEDGFVNDAEKIQLSTLMKEYSIEFAKAHTSMNKAIDNISLNKSNAEIRKAKEDLQKEIKDVDNKVGGLNDFIDGTFENNVLDKSEREAIKSNLNVLEREKADIDSQYNELYKNVFLDGQMKIDFKLSYDDFVSKYNSLISIINEILKKTTLIDTADRTNMDNAMNQLKITLAKHSTQYQKVLDYVGKKELDSVKQGLKGEISDVQASVGDLNNMLNGAFKDEIIDASEIKILEEHIRQLDKEKLDINAQYEQLYNNADLL